MVIYKYELQITGIQTVQMPAGAKILSVANQHGILCLWALVDPVKPKTDRNIAIFGTDQSIDFGENSFNDKHLFIGTVLKDPFSWHVFEVNE